MNTTQISYIILAIVALVAIAGFINLAMDNTNANVAKQTIWEQSGQYAKDATELNWQPNLGGRGRRYIEDAG